MALQTVKYKSAEVSVEKALASLADLIRRHGGRRPSPRSFGGFIESVVEKKKRRIEGELDL